MVGRRWQGGLTLGGTTGTLPKFAVVVGASGGIGRRAGFRFQWGDPSEFESLFAQRPSATREAIARPGDAEVAQW